MKNAKILTVLFAIAITTTTALEAQNWGRYGKSSHEVGFTLGSVHFHTDYGERGDSESNMANNGLGIGFIHYLTFTDYRYRWNQRASYFRHHFRLRNELSFYKGNLEMAGKWVDESRTSIEADKLRGMHGEAKTLNLGSQLEWHVLNIDDFGSRRRPKMFFSPYLAAGIQFVYSRPTLYTDYGDGNWKANRDLLYDKWAVEGTKDDPELTMAFTGSVGTRIKLSEYSDIIIEYKAHLYASDAIDALDSEFPTTLNPNVASKNNDYATYFHIGYSYYLN